MTVAQYRDSLTPLLPGVPRCYALVPCAGIGARAGAPGPKQYVRVAGHTLVWWTLQALSQVIELSAIMVVLAPDDTQFDALHAEDAWAPRLHKARVGASTRALSVASGLAALIAAGAQPHDWVLVHDAARCLITPAAVRRLIAACRDDAVGGLLAWPIVDTLKRAQAEMAAPDLETPRVAATLARQGVWAAQTPQMFRLGMLRTALQAASQPAGAILTDEASAIEALGLQPMLVRGDFENFKVTWPEDFAFAERLLRSRLSTTP